MEADPEISEERAGSSHEGGNPRVFRAMLIVCLIHVFAVVMVFCWNYSNREHGSKILTIKAPPVSNLSAPLPLPRYGDAKDGETERSLAPDPAQVPRREIDPISSGREQPRMHYQVVDGDTLGKIATSFGISRSSLLAANRRSEGQPLYINEILEIPGVPGILSNSGASLSHLVPSQVHIVREGETLRSIAEAYKVSENAVAEANEMSGRKTALRIGTDILVPNGAQNSGGEGCRTQSRATVIAGPEPALSHMVRFGETLPEIAGLHGVEVDDLVAANRLNGIEVEVGHRLVIPPEYREEVGAAEGLGVSTDGMPTGGGVAKADLGLFRSSGSEEIAAELSETYASGGFPPVVFEAGEAFVEIAVVKELRAATGEKQPREGKPSGQSREAIGDGKARGMDRINESVGSLFASIESRDHVMLEELLHTSPDLEVTDWNGRTPLVVATKAGDWKAVSLLVDHGADPLRKDEDGWSALFHSLLVENPPICRLLAERVAEMGSESGDGEMASIALDTALRLASYLDQDEEVRVLIEHEAAVDARGERGETALMLAAKKGNLGVVETLLNAGANFDAVNDRGKTARDLALEGGYSDVVEAVDIREIIRPIHSPALAGVLLIQPLEVREDPSQREAVTRVIGTRDPRNPNWLKLPYPYHEAGRIVIPSTFAAGGGDLLLQDPLNGVARIRVMVPTTDEGEEGLGVFAGGRRDVVVGSE